MIFIHARQKPDPQWETRQKVYDREHLIQAHDFAVQGWRGNIQSFRTAFGIAGAIHDATLRNRAFVGINRLLCQTLARTMVLIDIILNSAHEGDSHND